MNNVHIGSDGTKFKEGISYEIRYKLTKERLIWEEKNEWWRHEYVSPTRYYVSGYVIPHLFIKSHWEVINRQQPKISVKEMTDQEVRDTNKLYLLWKSIWENKYPINPWVKVNLKAMKK